MIITKNTIYHKYRVFYHKKMFNILVGDSFWDPKCHAILGAENSYTRFQNHVKKRGLIDVFTLNMLIALEHGPHLLMSAFCKLCDIFESYIEKYSRVYNLSLKVIDSIDNLDTSELGENPYLIKAGNDYYMWGFDRTWHLTPVTSSDIDFEWPECSVLPISGKNTFYNTFKNNHKIPTSSYIDYILMFAISPIIIILALSSIIIPIIPRLVRGLLGVIGTLLTIPFVMIYAYFEYSRCLKTIRCIKININTQTNLLGDLVIMHRIHNMMNYDRTRKIYNDKIFELTNRDEVKKPRTHSLENILQQTNELRTMFYDPEDFNAVIFSAGVDRFFIPFFTQEFQKVRPVIFGENNYPDVPLFKDLNQPATMIGQQIMMLICLLQQHSSNKVLLFAGAIIDYLIAPLSTDIRIKDMGFPCVTENAHLFFVKKALSIYTTRKKAKDNCETNLDVKDILTTSQFYKV